jgi:hypothetical protein
MLVCAAKTRRGPPGPRSVPTRRTRDPDLSTARLSHLRKLENFGLRQTDAELRDSARQLPAFSAAVRGQIARHCSARVTEMGDLYPECQTSIPQARRLCIATYELLWPTAERTVDSASCLSIRVGESPLRTRDTDSRGRGLHSS